MDFLEIFSSKSLLATALMIVAFLVAVIGHEIMHGYVAFRYGDDTAQKMGRLTINPIKHIDPIGSVALPLVLFFVQAPFLFGWAKPVPINMNYIIQRWGYGAGIAVSLAGVIYNLVLALILSVLLSSLFSSDESGIFGQIIVALVVNLIVYNIVLGVFNLWPIPPLDGAHALSLFCLKIGSKTIPRFFARISPYGTIIILLVLATPASQIFFVPMQFLQNFLLT